MRWGGCCCCDFDFVGVLFGVCKICNSLNNNNNNNMSYSFTDNVIYNGSSTSVISSATYEPLNDKQEASSQVR